MSDDQKNPGGEVPSDKAYEVGYGKPPKKTQWKKGQPSPNPSGRPRRVKDVVSVIDRIANEPVLGKNADAGREMTSQEALYRKEINAAMNGDQRAMALLISEMKRCRLILPKLAPEEEKKRGLLVVGGPAPSIEEWRAYHNDPARKLGAGSSPPQSGDDDQGES